MQAGLSAHALLLKRVFCCMACQPHYAGSQRHVLLPTALSCRKEQLWPYIREFSDNALTYVVTTMARLAAAGEACELYDIHGHYADAGVRGIAYLCDGNCVCCHWTARHVREGMRFCLMYTKRMLFEGRLASNSACVLAAAAAHRLSAAHAPASKPTQ
jgi:hypothetical protein